MKVYGRYLTRQHVWNVLMNRMLDMRVKKDNGVQLEQYGERLLLKEDLSFDDAGLVLKGNSLIRILICSPDTNAVEEIIDRENSALDEWMSGESDLYGCYYLADLDPEDPEQKAILDQMKEKIGGSNRSRLHVEFWDIRKIEFIFRQEPKIWEDFGSYIKNVTESNRLFSNEQKQTIQYIERYLEKCFMEDQFSKMEQAGSVSNEKVTLQKVFVDLGAVPENSGQNEEPALFVESMVCQGNFVNRVFAGENGGKETENECKQLGYVLLGKAGQGKSTVCQYLMQIYRAVYLERYAEENPRREVQAFLQEYKDNCGFAVTCFRIPIHIVTREYAAWIQDREDQGEAADVLFYIAQQIQKKTEWKPDVDILRELLHRLSWIFVFDGLDEVPDSSNRGRLIGEIREFLDGELRRANTDGIVICTSRPQGNLDGLGKEDFMYLQLEELSSDGCMEYLRRLIYQMGGSMEEQQKSMEVLRESVNDQIISRLMKTPLQATIVAILVKTGGKPPRDRYNLFYTYYDTMKKREKQKETLLTLHDTFEWMDRIHSRLALLLQRESESAANPSAAINRERFLALIREYLEEVEDEKEADGREARCRAFFRILTERLGFITDVNTEGQYMFSIRSMQEFLAASEIVSWREKRALEEVDRIASNIYWRNVFLFAVGYLNKSTPDTEADIRKICERLNGAECTPARYNMEKIAYAGSRLALDILLEGIYKGRTKVEKAFYDLFFQLKDRPLTDCLSECMRLPEEKRTYLKTEYILPALQEEGKNLTLWYLMAVLSTPDEIMDLLRNLDFSWTEKNGIFCFLNRKQKNFFWRGGAAQTAAEFSVELLEECGDIRLLSYDEYCRIVQYGKLEEHRDVRRIVYRKLLTSGEMGRVRNSVRRETEKYFPELWNQMERILERLYRKPETYEVAGVLTFQLMDSDLSEQDAKTLEKAAAWLEEEQLAVEASFLRLILRTDTEHMRAYLEEVWKEPYSEREKWLRVHMNQSYMVYRMLQEKKPEEAAHMCLEDAVKLADADCEMKIRELSEALKENRWEDFWNSGHFLRANCAHTKSGINNYLEATGRSCDKVKEMNDNELAHLIFVIAVNLEVQKLQPDEEAVAEEAYKEYRKRTWKICWVGIWARRIALYLMNGKSPMELMQDEDTYRAFLPTEPNSYLYRNRDIISWELSNLWNALVWMCETLQPGHSVLRVLPAVLLASPRLEVRLGEKKYRQLLGAKCEDRIAELGRLLFLLLVPDWSEEEAECLGVQILEYLKEESGDMWLLFARFGKKYDKKKSCADSVWEKLYVHLCRIQEKTTEKQGECQEQLCELAYVKIMGEVL